MIATRDDLGIGIYTPEEAAFYARVSTRLMKRWIFGDSQGDSVVVPQIDEHDEGKVITFLDFVQALAIRSIRSNFKIPLQKIRQAVQQARDNFGVEYPFAMRHTTFLFSDKKLKGHGEIVIRIQGRGIENEDEFKEKYIQLSGKNRGNLMMNQIVEVYLDDLNFDDSGIATQYCAWKQNEGTVVMNPHTRFGEPVIPSCGYTAQTLYEASINEGSLDAAAEAYGVSRDDVKLAWSYFDHLKNIAV